jgi:kynureninase
MKVDISLEGAKALDLQFSGATRRGDYLIPGREGKELIYFCGNSLGLQPLKAQEYVLQELADWAELGVEGHFHGKRPWFDYHKQFAAPLSRLVGALPQEVVVMNNLTVNLHLLMVTFYRPTGRQYKIIMEAGAFPSDQYAVETQVRLQGMEPEEAIIELEPRPGEHTLRTEDILQKIEEHAEETALVLMGGVNYYTGQFFDLKAISSTARKYGIKVGFDLAHAVGNVVLSLHEWDVDFACWCSYKYLNSGPGGSSGVFIHERNAQNTSLPRFGGWWGHDERERFLMRKGFKPMPTAEGWQLSNAQILPMAAHLAALELFDQVGMTALREKSLSLTAFAQACIDQINQRNNHPIQIITPTNTAERGCQLSLIFKKDGKRIFSSLQQAGIVADWREPDVIRIAPVPMYNTFEEVWNFARHLEQSL